MRNESSSFFFSLVVVGQNHVPLPREMHTVSVFVLNFSFPDIKQEKLLCKLLEGDLPPPHSECVFPCVSNSKLKDDVSKMALKFE